MNTKQKWFIIILTWIAWTLIMIASTKDFIWAVIGFGPFPIGAFGYMLYDVYQDLGGEDNNSD